MPVENPRDRTGGRSLSKKLRDLTRLGVKPEDKKPQAEFQIVHTPDRRAPSRPAPTEEECRNEIRKWHQAADRQRAAYEQLFTPVVANFAERDTRDQGRGGEPRNKYEFRDDDEDSDERGVVKGEKYGKSSLSSKISSNPGSYPAGGIGSDSERDRGEGKGVVVADAYHHEKADRRPSPPAPRPQRPPREDEHASAGAGPRRQMTFPQRVSGFLAPPSPPQGAGAGAATTKPVRIPLAKSPSISSFANVSDLSYSDEAELGEAQLVDKDQLYRMELYKRSVCPLCRSTLSPIELFRCGHCHGDLLPFRNIINAHGASIENVLSGPARPSQSHSQSQSQNQSQSSSRSQSQSRSQSRSRTGTPIPDPAYVTPQRPPPAPIRERTYLGQVEGERIPYREHAQALEAKPGKHGAKFAHFPPPVTKKESNPELKPRSRLRPSPPPQPQPQPQPRWGRQEVRERGQSPERRTASTGRVKEERVEKPELPPVSEYHRWQTPEQRAEQERLERENGDDADLFMEIYEGYMDEAAGSSSRSRRSPSLSGSKTPSKRRQ